MTKRQQPDSSAVAAARVDLAAIVDDLKGIKARAPVTAKAIGRRIGQAMQ